MMYRTNDPEMDWMRYSDELDRHDADQQHQFNRAHDFCARIQAGDTDAEMRLDILEAMDQLDAGDRMIDIMMMVKHPQKLADEMQDLLWAICMQMVKAEDEREEIAKSRGFDGPI